MMYSLIMPELFAVNT